MGDSVPYAPASHMTGLPTDATWPPFSTTHFIVGRIACYSKLKGTITHMQCSIDAGNTKFTNIKVLVGVIEQNYT